MEYLGYTISIGKILVSTKKVEAVADWPMPTTHKEVRCFVQFCNFHARFIHHFSDLTAPLTGLVRRSQPHKVTLSFACLEAFETLKLRLISAPCLILPEVGSDATFTVATHASTMKIAAIMLQDQGGGLQPVSYLARKLNPAERGNTYSAYDLEALAVCEDVKHWRCYLEGCFKFLVVTNHDTLRHLLRQPNNRLNKRQARYLRDLQPFVGSMTPAYRKGALNEADPLSRRPNFVPQATFPLFWDGEVPSYRELRRKSQLLFEDAQLNLLTVNALQLSPKFADLIREGYSQDSFYGDEGEWTKDSRIEDGDGYFWRLDRLCIPQNYELRLRLITKLHESSPANHGGVTSTLAKALDMLWWKRLRQDMKDFCERCVVCRRAKIQPQQMAATLYPLPGPPKPWHTVGLDYLTHLHESNGFNNVLIVVDHLARMAHFLPCTLTVTAEETATLFLQGVYRLHGLPRVMVSDRTRNSSVAFGRHFGGASERA
jgi:hypothetical protein